MKNHNKSKKNCLNILQILSHSGFDDITQTVLNTGNYLAENGCKSFIVSQEKIQEKTDKERTLFNQETFQNLPLASKNPFVAFSNIKKLINIIKKNHINIVHIHSRTSAWSAFFAARSCSVPFITSLYRTYSAKNKLKSLYNSIMIKGIKIIAASDVIKDHIIKKHKIAPERIEVIYNGVDINKFNPDKISQERINNIYKATKIGRGLPVILIPEEINNEKNYEFLIEALINVPKDLYNCIFLEGADKKTAYVKNFKKRIKQLSLDKNIFFSGKTEDMPALYSIADIVVSASGKLSMEAQAMGKSVIALNINNKKTQEIIPLETPESSFELSQAINNFLKSGAKEKRNMSKKARLNITENFNTEKMQQKTLELYKNICGIN